jgi:hypothetical protein
VKFNAQHTPCDLGAKHHTHDSKAEQARCVVLHIKQNIGDIHGLMIHERFKLEVNDFLVSTYESDFSYTTPDGEFVVEDVKSPPTKKLESYQIKKALMRAVHGIEILETS